MKYTEKIFKDRAEWLEWRHKGIGSSDASAIMGVSRFKTREELLKEKILPVAEEQANTYIIDRGNKIEALVRDYLEKEYKTTFQPMNCESVRFPFLRCSLDGITPDRKTIIEIKLLSSVNPAKVNTEAEGYKKWLAAKNDFKIPKEYWPQIEHQLMISGAKECWFIGYKEIKGEAVLDPEQLAVVKVNNPNDFLSLPAMIKFWMDVMVKEESLEREIE